MKRKWLQLLLMAMVSLALCATAGAAQGKKAQHAAKKIVLTPDQIQWKQGPPELPDSQMAVIDGNPKSKGFFVMRVKLPAGTRIPTHSHGNAERVTVLSGSLKLAMGAEADNPVTLPAGSYFVMPPNTVHNASVDEETILQIATMGPWSMHVQKGAKKPAGAETQQ